MGGYAPDLKEHTFSTGRTFLIRPALPMTLVAVDAMGGDDSELASALVGFASGDADSLPELASGPVAAKVVRRIVETMFVRPRVRWGDESVLEPGWEDEDPGSLAVIPSVWLEEAEVQEVMEIARLGIEGATRFRSERSGAPRRSNGKGVAKGSKRGAGSAAR